ncbi:MAG: hypothetical protein IT557_18100 [Alphaproteobacteria bacterium]|nr:hypothetical protein [Alphaproteobacteria bacterium]
MTTIYEPVILSAGKEDYGPGATALISAEGVVVGGTLAFQVQHVSDAGADGLYGTYDDTVVVLGGAGHDVFYVTDGGEGDLDGVADGKITTGWVVNEDDS